MSMFSDSRLKEQLTAILADLEVGIITFEDAKRMAIADVQSELNTLRLYHDAEIKRQKHIQHLKDNPPSPELLAVAQKLSEPGEFRKQFDHINSLSEPELCPVCDTVANCPSCNPTKVNPEAEECMDYKEKTPLVPAKVVRQFASHLPTTNDLSTYSAIEVAMVDLNKRYIELGAEEWSRMMKVYATYAWDAFAERFVLERNWEKPVVSVLARACVFWDQEQKQYLIKQLFNGSCMSNDIQLQHNLCGVAKVVANGMDEKAIRDIVQLNLPHLDLTNGKFGANMAEFIRRYK